MPINFKSKAPGIQNLAIKGRSGNKKLSLSMKSKCKNSKYSEKSTMSNTNLAVQLPTIGQLFVTKLNKRIDSSRENKTGKKEGPLRLLKEENFNRINSVKSKILQNSRERKQLMESRRKLMSIPQTNSKTNEESKDFEDKLDTSILEDHPSPERLSPKQYRKQQNPSFLQFYENLQNLKKITICVDAGVQTESTQLNKQSYEEYIKLRIIQRQKFEKLRNLFKYIQSLERLESENFRKNIQEYQKMFHSKDTSFRQQRASDLMNELNQKYLSFHDIFKDVFLTERQNFKDFHQIQSDFLAMNKKLISDLDQKVSQISDELEIPQDENPFRDAIQQIFQKQQLMSKENNRIFNDKMTIFYKNYKDLEEKYNQWSQHSAEQSRLIKNCVTNILELPELSNGLFGTDKSNDHSLTNSQIKASCTDDEVVPLIIDFFMRRDHPESRQINQIFLKCCQVKCMNCIYLRTKMRYIYHKNSEIKPVVKVLMNLIQTETTQAQFQKISTHKNLIYASKRVLQN